MYIVLKWVTVRGRCPPAPDPIAILLSPLGAAMLSIAWAPMATLKLPIPLTTSGKSGIPRKEAPMAAELMATLSWPVMFLGIALAPIAALSFSSLTSSAELPTATFPEIALPAIQREGDDDAPSWNARQSEGQLMLDPPPPEELVVEVQGVPGPPIQEVGDAARTEVSRPIYVLEDRMLVHVPLERPDVARGDVVARVG